MYKFNKEDMKYRNITKTKWTNKKFVMKQVIPVPGAPLGIKETRVVVKYQIIEQNENCLIIESCSENMDTPSADTYTVKCSWMVFGSSKAPDQCMLMWIMVVDWIKFSFFKKLIQPKSEEACNDAVSKWFTAMTNKGLFKQQPKPEPEPIDQPALNF